MVGGENSVFKIGGIHLILRAVQQVRMGDICIGFSGGCGQKLRNTGRKILLKAKIIIQRFADFLAVFFLVSLHIHKVFNGYMPLHAQPERAADNLVYIGMPHQISANMGQIRQRIGLLLVGIGIPDQRFGKITGVAVVQHIKPIPIRLFHIALQGRHQIILKHFADHASEGAGGVKAIIGAGLQRQNLFKHTRGNGLVYQLVKQLFGGLQAVFYIG